MAKQTLSDFDEVPRQPITMQLAVAQMDIGTIVLGKAWGWCNVIGNVIQVLARADVAFARSDRVRVARRDFAMERRTIASIYLR